MSAPSDTADSAGDTASLSQGPVEPKPLSKDTIFHILQVERRRLTLQYLHGQTDSVSMRDLAEQVAAWENETTIDQLSSSERQRTYIALYQTHLPKLDSEGLIKYNKDRGTILRTSRADQLDPYLSKVVQQDSSSSFGTRMPDTCASNQQWERYYMGGTLFSASLLAAELLHVPLVSQLASWLIFAVIVFVFTVISAGHHYSRTALPKFGSDSTFIGSFFRQNSS